MGARVFLSGGLLLWIVLLRDGAAFGVRSLGAKGFGYASLLAVGIASAVSQAVEAGAFSGMTVIAGRLGASVVAGYQILLNLMAFVFMLALVPAVLVVWPLVALVPSRRLALWTSRWGSLYTLRAMGCSLRLEGDRPIGREGTPQSHWVLVDFGSVILHVFTPPEREYYGLEKHWQQAKVVLRVQ